MREAMNNEEPDMDKLGRKLNVARSKLLQDLKTSLSEVIPPEVISIVVAEKEVEEERVVKADQDLEKIVGELFEMKLTADENA